MNTLLSSISTTHRCASRDSPLWRSACPKRPSPAFLEAIRAANPGRVAEGVVERVERWFHPIIEGWIYTSIIITIFSLSIMKFSHTAEEKYFETILSTSPSAYFI